MAEAYTVFWARERCDTLRRLGGVGKPLTLLFGGPHTSEPSFLRATVRSGDTVYPISLHRGILYVLGSARVGRILTLESFVDARPDLFADHLREPPEWVLARQHMGVSPRGVQVNEAFDRLRVAMPELRYLAPTCTEEVVECEDSTPLRLDLAIPPDLLQRMRYRSRRRERDLLKDIHDGRLIRSLGIQGIYRLSDSSARELQALVDQSTLEVRRAPLSD